MDTHRRGDRYETVAARHLEARGWRILARNFRSGRNEIDLIVRRGATVAFVEVKGRADLSAGHPLESITAVKRHDLARVARAWIRTHGPPGVDYRFDAVAVVGRPGARTRIEHVPDAWWVELPS